MAVSFDHLRDAEALAQLEHLVVFVRGVDQHRFTGLFAPQDIDVVVHRPDDELMDSWSTVFGAHERHASAVPAAPSMSRPAGAHQGFELFLGNVKVVNHCAGTTVRPAEGFPVGGWLLTFVTSCARRSARRRQE